MIFALQGEATPEVPAHRKFVSISTPHFLVIAAEDQEDLGQYYAGQLERAHTRLGKIFSLKPEKTVVVINDKWDITNGYATRVPYPHMMIYPTLPGPGESLGDYGQWTYELLVHEYTHILNFEPAPGTMGYFRNIFGTIIAPNILLPNWWKEGVAVEMETRLTPGGRLRSLYQDSVLRALVLEGSLQRFNLAEVNEVLPSWPEGLRPYLFGSLFWTEVLNEQGEEKADELFQAHGARVPYFIETPARRILKDNYANLYGSSLVKVEERVQSQLGVLKSQPPTPIEKIKVKGFDQIQNPSLSPSGRWMAFIAKDETESRRIRILQRNSTTNDFLEASALDDLEAEKGQDTTSKVLEAPPEGAIQRISWFNKSDQFVFDKVDAVNSIEKRSDLWIYNLRSKKSVRLTSNLRGREPHVSPDDTKIAFVSLEKPNRTALALWENGAARILHESSWDERISWPVFLNDSEILFSWKKSKTQENLWVYSLLEQSIKPWNSGLSQARFVAFRKQQIFAVSETSGVPNVYRLNLDSKPIPLTHFLSGAFVFDVDPINGDLYITHMTGQGPWIGKVTRSKDSPAATPPAVKPLFADRYQFQETPTSSTEYPKEAYSSTQSLGPKYWIPFIASTPNGILFQASTSGFDPLKKHNYSLSGDWDSYLNRWSWSGSYVNQTLHTPWFLQTSSRSTYLVNSEDVQSAKTNALGILPDLWRLNKNLSSSLNFRHVEYDFNGVRTRGQGPGLSLTYANISQAGMQISPESGGAATLGASAFTRFKSTDLAHSQYLASASYYWSKWLPKRHALKFKTSGVYTPQKVSHRFGATTSPLSLQQEVVGPEFLMRGYNSGHFLGRNMVNLNVEYRFPIRQIARGSGTDPYFIRRLSGSLLVDGVAHEGFAYKEEDATYVVTDFSKKYWSYGAELRLQTTLGYVLPVDFVVYYYAPENKSFAKRSSAGFTLQFSIAQ